MPPGWIASVALIDGQQLAAEHFDEEVAGAAGGFEESGLDAFALVLNEIEHVIDEAGRGENLSVIDDALTRFHRCNCTGTAVNGQLWGT